MKIVANSVGASEGTSVAGTVNVGARVLVGIVTAVDVEVGSTTRVKVAEGNGSVVAVTVKVGVAVDVSDAESAATLVPGVREGSSTEPDGVELESERTIANIRANASTPTTAIATITSLPTSRRIYVSSSGIISRGSVK